MAQMEQAQQRLDNIRAVEPMLSALRMIALGGWQAAQKQNTAVSQYSDRLLTLLPYLVPHLSLKQLSKPANMTPCNKTVVFVIGSDRGLCGRFNTAVVNYAEAFMAEQESNGVDIELQVLGSRARRLLEKGKRPLSPHPIPPIIKLPSFKSIHATAQQWLKQFEAQELDKVLLITNRYQGIGRYQPSAMQLLPVNPLPLNQTSSADSWPEPIIETDPLSLYSQIVQQWVSQTFFSTLLDSLMSEQSTRYQLMDSAAKNAENLITELATTIQTARRQKITQEMQTIATHTI